MIEIDKETFNHEVLETEQPVLVDFWGPSCRPCLELMPEVESLAEKYQERVKIVKLNTMSNRRVCIDYQVMGLPSFLLFKNGEEVTRISGGNLSATDIENLILENT